MKNSALTPVLAGCQIAFLVTGLAAALVPEFPKTRAFWGCNRAWTSMAPNQIRVDAVLPGSPARIAGLRDGDVVLSIDGRTIDGAEAWDEMAERLRPRQAVRLQVQRGAEQRTITAQGPEPQREAVAYYAWQLAFSGVSALFLILLIATQPLRPLASPWRPILLVLAGLAGIAALLFTDSRSEVAPLLDRQWPVDNLPFPWFQLPVCVVVAVVLVALGTWEIRGMVQRCQEDGTEVIRGG